MFALEQGTHRDGGASGTRSVHITQELLGSVCQDRVGDAAASMASASPRSRSSSSPPQLFGDHRCRIQAGLWPKQDPDGPAASDDTAFHDRKGGPLDDRERVNQVNQAFYCLARSYNRGRRIEGNAGASLLRSQLNGGPVAREDGPAVISGELELRHESSRTRPSVEL